LFFHFTNIIFQFVSIKFVVNINNDNINKNNIDNNINNSNINNDNKLNRDKLEDNVREMEEQLVIQYSIHRLMTNILSQPSAEHLTINKLQNEIANYHENETKFSTFKQHIHSQLKEMRNIIIQELNDKSKYDELQKQYDEDKKIGWKKEQMLNSKIITLNKDKERLNKEAKSKENKGNKLRTRINEQQSQIASHKKKRSG